MQQPIDMKDWMADVTVNQLDLTLHPDPMRTVIRPFMPADPKAFVKEGHPRGERIVARVLALDEAEVLGELQLVHEALEGRHRDVDELFTRRFGEVEDIVCKQADPTDMQKLLIGAYFSAEYSFEAAALFNPSVVAHPDQADAAEGDTRLVISLRGIGEGHLSSVTFRTGTWHADDTVTIDKPSGTAVAPVIEKPEGWHDGDTVQLDCRGSREPSETVLFPVVDSQSRGIEDLRLTPFEGPEGHTFGGTFTALGSDGVQQQMLKTEDFRTFKMHPVTGDWSGAKGMALFPRQIGDRYAAIGRHDSENLWYATSDDLFTWGGGEKILEPAYPWESVQLGNCGSPMEIDEGWLLLTHGVGVLRSYCLAAALLDRDDPSRVIGRLTKPLIAPGPDRRDGYVPNVVYSCGGMVRGRTLLLPYAIADQFTSFATVPIDELVAAME